MRDIFIVSASDLVDKVADGSFESPEIEGLSIEILKASGEKCERCWKYFTMAQGSTQSVCGRCGEALKSYDAAE